MDPNTLRTVLQDIAAEAVPTPLADRALRGAARRRKTRAGLGVAVAAAVLAAIPFLLPGNDRAIERPGPPAAGVSSAPAAPSAAPSPTISASPPPTVPSGTPSATSAGTGAPARTSAAATRRVTPPPPSAPPVTPTTDAGVPDSTAPPTVEVTAAPTAVSTLPNGE